MKIIVFAFLLFLATFTQAFCQKVAEAVVVYTSYAGTFDKTLNPARAQFAGNNKLIQAHLNENREAFLVNEVTMRRDLYQDTPMLTDIVRTAAVRFKVDRYGKVEDVKIVKKSGLKKLDNVVSSVLAGTSGKWRPGIVNNQQVEEEITLWIHVYTGNKRQKDFQVYAKEGDAFFAKADYKNAIKAYDVVLRFDELNTHAVSQKGLALVKSNRRKSACKLWKRYQKYDTEEVKALLQTHCN